MITNEKMNKKILSGAVAMVFIVLFISSAFATTARIGNSRMILRAGVGETVERYVLVMNVNEGDVTIDLSVTGDLVDNLVLEEDSFVLKPGEEKKVFFTIRADEESSTTTKINVAYSSDQDSGVGLTSTVILIAAEEFEGTTQIIERESEFKISSSLLLSVSGIALILLVLLLFMYHSKAKTKKRARRASE